MKVAILGGGGFIGSAVVDRLLIDGHQVVVFERPGVVPFRRFRPDERMEWIVGEFLDRRDLGKALRGADAVIHLISTTLPKSSNDDPAFDVRTNLLGTLSLLDLMVEKGIKRIVYISSGGTVYGTPHYLPIDENHPTEPMVSYGVNKLAIEKYLIMYRQLRGLEPVILRVTNPFGKRQGVDKAQGAVGIFLHQVMAGHTVEIWGDGLISRDYIHVSDVAQAFSKAIVYSGKASVFNISTGVGTTLNQLLALIGDATGLQPRVVYRPARPFDVPVSILDPSLAAAGLGWTARMPLERGIAETAHWLRAREANATVQA